MSSARLIPEDPGAAAPAGARAMMSRTVSRTASKLGVSAMTRYASVPTEGRPEPAAVKATASTPPGPSPIHSGPSS
ncbi:MAG: hypothetical protein SOY67_08235 [Collinsella sp.]|nr:hypothetical protein [Collinsella sp.]